MNRRHSILVLVFLQACFYLQAQQDPQYSQYMFNQLVINPAYAGTRDAISTTMVMRYQWVGVSGAPNTQTFSIHSPIKKKKIGIGFHVVADQIGPVKNTGAFGSYSYKMTLPKGKLSLGLRFGVYQYVYDWSSITHYDQIDPVYQQLQLHSTYYVPSADFGAYYYTSDYYAGFSVTQLFNGRISSVVDPSGDYSSFVPHYFFTMGKAFELNESIIINPSFLLKTAYDSPLSADINCNLLLEHKVWAGLSFRTDFGLVFLTQLNVSDKFHVGCSYDWGFNELTKLSGGSYEFSAGYNFNTLQKSNVFSPRYF